MAAPGAAAPAARVVAAGEPAAVLPPASVAAAPGAAAATGAAAARGAAAPGAAGAAGATAAAGAVGPARAAGAAAPPGAPPVADPVAVPLVASGSNGARVEGNDARVRAAVAGVAPTPSPPARAAAVGGAASSGAGNDATSAAGTGPASDDDPGGVACPASAVRSVAPSVRAVAALPNPSVSGPSSPSMRAAAPLPTAPIRPPATFGGSDLAGPEPAGDCGGVTSDRVRSCVRARSRSAMLVPEQDGVWRRRPARRPHEPAPSVGQPPLEHAGHVGHDSRVRHARRLHRPAGRSPARAWPDCVETSSIQHVHTHHSE